MQNNPELLDLGREQLGVAGLVIYATGVGQVADHPFRAG